MRATLLALCLLATGCEVVVLGDSNSCSRPYDGCLQTNTLWPLEVSRLSVWPHWTVKNRAVPGLAAGRYSDPLVNGEPSDGMWHLERIIREDLADACLPLIGRLVARRKLVIALGTNDIGSPERSGAKAGAAVLALYDRASEVPCVDVYVATIPPSLVAPPGAADTANDLIRKRVPRNHVIPFGDEPVSDLNASGVHMTIEAQMRRAATASAVLFSWL